MSDQTSALEHYYATVKERSNLRTPAHAQRWSRAILRTLGFNLDRGAKRKLSDALPKELAGDLTRGWRLVHFRDKNLPAHEFYRQAALCSGNSDPAFARTPTQAVFHGVKQLVDNDIEDFVARSLSPELRTIWEEA